MRRREIHRTPGAPGKKIFTVLLAFLSAWYLWNGDTLFPGTPLYQPTPEVRHLIVANAARFRLSPELIQAVIATESKFDSRAISHTGAVGMMQLMPDTAEWIAKESGLPAENLKSPEENLALGSWYLYYLIDKYDGNLVLALAAYNAGRGNVDEWMERKGWPRDFARIDDIPFPETREFVRSVITCRDALKEAKET